MKSDKLKDFRESLGVTQEWLANRLGVTRQTIARWEGGDVEVPQYIDLAVGQLLRSKAALPEYVRSVMNREHLSVPRIVERAKRVGYQLSISYLNNMLQGLVTSPSVEKLKALAAGLGCPEREVFRAAGVNTGESWSDLEAGRFAAMAQMYRALSHREQKRIEVLIAVLERELREAVVRDGS